MKHKEEEIINIAKDALKKLEFPYDNSVDLNLTVMDGNSHRFSKPTWMVELELKFPKQLTPKRSAFLFIDDETGIPLLIFHDQAKIYLTLNEDGTIEKTVKRYGED